MKARVSCRLVTIRLECSARCVSMTTATLALASHLWCPVAFAVLFGTRMNIPKARRSPQKHPLLRVPVAPTRRMCTRIRIRIARGLAHRLLVLLSPLSVMNGHHQRCLLPLLRPHSRRSVLGTRQLRCLANARSHSASVAENRAAPAPLLLHTCASCSISSRNSSSTSSSNHLIS